jgi:outer membrane protein OmpA-like peptidoglycan-associated protein
MNEVALTYEGPVAVATLNRPQRRNALSLELMQELIGCLDEIGRNLDANVRVTVVGHTDSTGSDQINDPLSRERALAVRDYLGARGVSSSRISIAGRGSHEPVASNDTEQGRAANRRVEIFLSEPQG